MDRIIHALRTEGSWNAEVRGKRRDGRVIDVQVSSNLVTGPAGNPICLIGSFKDVTEQKAMVEALRKNEELLRAAAQAAGVGIYDHDRRNDTIYWSPEQRENYGAGADQIITLDYFIDRVHPDDRERIAAAARHAHTSGSDGQFYREHRIIRHDGAIRWLVTRGRTFFEGEGSHRRPVRTVGAVFDVTDSVSASDERVALERQLLQSQKLEAVGQLTGGMAHDFNNLLAIIIGNLDLLAVEIPHLPLAAELAEDALGAATRGAELTRQLLAFARRQMLQPRPIDVSALLGETVKLLRHTLQENIDIVTQYGPGLWPVTVDPAQLEAALTNLATNARDAMPKGGRLTFTAANVTLDAAFAAGGREVVPGDYVAIEVRDTGVGMPPDMLGRIFEPFFTSKSEGQGTGLGLSMVFGFVKQSGGHIDVASEPGVGTVFHLYLPRGTQSSDAGGVAASPIEAAGSGERVLAVEDNRPLRATVVRQLEGLGYKVCEAESATEALAVLEREPVDVVFTDIMMPGAQDGIDLADHAARRWPNLRILLTSGVPNARPDAIRSLPVRCGFLPKPYRKADLARALRKLLDDSSD